MVISGNFNFSNIFWDTIANTTDVNELRFTEILNDHFLTQLNNTSTRGNNVLDLVLTSVPDHVLVTDVLSPDQAAIFTDHCVISFEFRAFIKAPTKTHRRAYDCAKGDFEGLYTDLCEINLSESISDDDEDINADWQRWKDTFLAAVSDHIPIKKLKGRNTVPWINGTIRNMIKKKDSVRKKPKSRPSNYFMLRDKFRSMHAEITKAIRESRDDFFHSVERDFKNNPKRFRRSILKLTSKSHNIPDVISMAKPGVHFLSKTLAHRGLRLINQ